MAFLKFSRDKRGYENYYLLEGQKGGPRLLFWFRTPPHVKVGRSPFSDDVRAMVEAENPGVSFDWPRILATPIPSADAEKWRERRRAEKAAKRAARAAAAEEQAAAAPEDVDAESVPDATIEAERRLAPAESAASTSQVVAPGASEARRRRRRRGRRGRHGHADVTGQPGPSAPAETAAGEPVAAEPESPSAPGEPPITEV